MDVVGLGENSYDHLCTLAGDPVPGAKHFLAGYETRAGGQIASALLGCAKLGLRCAYLGAVGDDAAADAVLAPLASGGIDVSGVRHVVGARTRTAVVLVRGADGMRSVLAHRDPALSIDPGALDARAIKAARVLLIDASDPDAAHWAAGVARRAGVPVVLDADRYDADVERVLRVTDFPVVARDFADEWGSGPSAAAGLDACLEALVGWGARVAVVTLGPEGARAREGKQGLTSPAFPVTVRDTTGSGDAFHAGFVLGLLQGWRTERMLQVANAVAALTCRALGAQAGQPTRSELDDFLRAQGVDATQGGTQDDG